MTAPLLDDPSDLSALRADGGGNVVLVTPTGSGKSLVASGALDAALAADRRGYYTAPIKALVSGRFFALWGMFGAANVGML